MAQSIPRHSLQICPPPAKTISGNDNPLFRSSSAGNVAIDVTVKVKLVWQGTGTPASPPQSVKITADASGYSATSGTVATQAPEANNGFDGAQMQPMMQNSNNGMVPYGTSAQSHGIHLVKVPVGSGGTTIDVGTYTMRAFGSSGGSAAPTSSVRFEAAADLRSVNISRSGARWEVVDAEGNTHGHTVYSHTQHSVWSDLEWLTNWQSFSGSRSGFQSSPIQWSWDPAHSTATIDSNLWSMPFGSQNIVDGQWKGTTRPTERTLTYSVYDPWDGASATATYHMTIHDRFEMLTHNVDNSVIRNVRPAGSPDVRNESNVSVEVPGGYLERSDSYSIGIELGINEAVSLWVASLHGISLSYTVTLNAGQQAAAINLPPHTYSYLEMFDTYAHHWGTTDTWDEAGYLGVANYDFTAPRAPGYGIRMHDTIPLTPGGGTGGG